MKTFGKYIAKNLFSFAALVLLLLLVGIVSFGCTFRGIITKDYGETSPSNMLEEAASSATIDGIADSTAEKLKEKNIWAAYLTSDGNTAWKLYAPEEIPDSFTLQDVALFSKGYLADYPVFVRNMDNGILVLGYPKNSYTKLTSNYFSIRSIRTLPLFVIGMLAADLFILFLAYYYSKRKILKNTEPIITSIEALGNGQPVSLSVSGELSEVADSIRRASQVISRQTRARANWISGVSHDIRTPLSMILGYAERITKDTPHDSRTHDEAEIIKQQGIKIKELVLDLNLVSQLEYEMQPLKKTKVRLAGLLRSYAADLLNTGLPDIYPVEIDVSRDAESATLDCDARLLSRAVNNLIQNSIRHNPDGCRIELRLSLDDGDTVLTVADNGKGLSDEKQKELLEKPHYLSSTDDRLDLRHGLGLVLVRQIVEAHGGIMEIKSKSQNGFIVNLRFSGN